MSIKYESEIKRIIEASEKHALTFFVGAGVSKLSGVPNWSDLIDAICKEMGIVPKSEYSSEDLLAIPQKFYYLIKEDNKRYYDFIESQIAIKTSPNEIHKLLLGLKPVSILTTNYDTLLEDAANELFQSYKCVAQDKDIPSISGDKFILKVHGDFAHNNIVLKEEDYLDYEENFKLISTLMKSIFATNVVVFVGYKVNDYNIKLILNWVKHLLNDKFKPIFIYTDDAELKYEDLVYLNSRGLDVIDFHQFYKSGDSVEFEQRYKKVLQSIYDYVDMKVERFDETEAFQYLSGKLEPLDELYALRASDISKTLGNSYSVGASRVLFIDAKTRNMFKKYLEMISSETLEGYTKKDVSACKLISKVFQKARIYSIESADKYYKIPIATNTFSDELCLTFNYSEMRAYCSKSFVTASPKYKQAFYFTRLGDFETAYRYYSEAAKLAYADGDLLLFFLAEINLINLSKVLKQTNGNILLNGSQDINVQPLFFENEEDLYFNMPLEFQDKYASLLELVKGTFLYKYCFEAFKSGEKLNKAIDTHAREFGITSCDKVVDHINEYIHFMIGNGLCLDIYIEYKESIRNLMSILIKQYCNQYKKDPFDDGEIPNYGKSDIHFNYIDFYCFIMNFNSDEIEYTFAKNKCERIEFDDAIQIEASIRNLYKQYLWEFKSSPQNRNGLRMLQSEIKSCLSLMKYMDISVELFNETCDFLLNNNIPGIVISDKILFIDVQEYKYGKFDNKTQYIIERSLLKYLDIFLSYKENGKTFDMPTKRRDISFHNLAQYIDPTKKGYISHSLSVRVSKIIERNYTDLACEIGWKYWNVLSEYQHGKIKKWVSDLLSQDFNYDLFILLINRSVKMGRQYEQQCVKYLDKYIINVYRSTNAAVKIDSTQRPYAELVNIGGLCFLGLLTKSNYAKFQGVNDEFDFLFQYQDFDFGKFNPEWLIDFSDKLIEKIASKKTVRRKIQKVVNKSIDEHIYTTDIENKLIRIVCHYLSE